MNWNKINEYDHDYIRVLDIKKIKIWIITDDFSLTFCLSHHILFLLKTVIPIVVD